MTAEQISKFEKYLNLSYNPSTARQYLRLFKLEGARMFTQEGIDNFLSIHRDQYNYINPLYRGFVKAVIDCFHLQLMVPKSRRKGKKEHEDYKFIAKEDINKIIDNTKPRIALLVRLFFETGLRLKEMFNLKIEDVDLGERTFEGIGKGNKAFTVKFSEKSAELLLPYMLYHEKELKENKADLLFFDGNKHPARAFQYALKKECNKLSIKNMTPHKIRHSLGHHLRADIGFDLEQIRVKLRHADVGTTQIYARAEQEEVDKKMDREVFEQ